MNLGLLQSLKVATFDGNRITNLPDERKSRYVTSLMLSGLFFSYMSHTLCSNYRNFLYSVGQLVKLERLSVSANLLTSLPDTIGSLRSVSDLLHSICYLLSLFNLMCL